MLDLREGLESMASEGIARGADHVLAGAREMLEDAASAPRRGTRRRGGTLAVALVLVVALIGGIATVLTALARRSTRTSASADIEYLLPRHVPTGFTIVHTANGVTTDSPAPPEWTRTQRWVRFARDGEPTQVIDVQWGSPQSGGSPRADGLEEYRAGGTPIEVRGHAGLQSSADGWLVWEEHPGEIVYVSAKNVPLYGQNATALPASIVERVAASLRSRSDGGFTVAHPPIGFTLLAEWPESGIDGSRPRAAAYTGPNGSGFEVQLVDNTEQPPGSSPLLLHDRRVDVNGATGMLTSFLTTPPAVVVDGAPLFSGATRHLQWIDAAGTRVTISARHLTDPMILSIARSLVPVSEATWDRYLANGIGTKPLVSPTTLTPGTTAAPPPGAQHFAGSYQGIEHYTLQTARCPQLDHNLVETFTLSSGAIWNFQNLYCGTLLDTNLWHGKGTFSFTAGGGTFGGDTDVVARVPTSGGPIALHVTRGTGAYAGASGWCQLDNHIRQIAFGVQEQSGTFTCDIAFDEPNAPAG